MSTVPWRRFRRHSAAVLGLSISVAFVILAVLAPFSAPGDPTRFGDHAFLPPGSSSHVLGTDDMGRDVLGSVMHGARVSIAVAVLAAIASTILGTAIGGVAGYVVGWVDDALMRITDLFLITPRFIVAVVMAAYFGPSLLNVIVILGILSFPMSARLIRGTFLTVRELEFVSAARAIGAGHWRIAFQHMLPNAVGPLVVNASYQAGTAIVMEAGLSFLGLSDPAVMSWGRMLHNAQPFLHRAWWMAVIPGLSIVLLVLALNLIGDGLEHAVNPKAQ